MANLVTAYDRKGNKVQVFEDELAAGEGRYLWSKVPAFETKEEKAVIKVKQTPRKTVVKAKR